jgi:MYXO-CTERM domain-containing protein
MRPSLFSLSSFTLAALASATTFLTPDTAQACGGTFCDGQAMPVEQTGENILFVKDGQRVEAHIQIQYNPDTDASQFAWVIPVPTVPEFSVGSQPLFDNLLNGSVPRYGRNVSFTCDDNNFADETGGESSSDSGSGEGGQDGGTGSDPTVVLEETVGAYDITVLQGGTVESLMQWLGDNGYTQDPAAEPVFADYLDKDFLFVALKLTTNAEVDEIHPIVLTQEGPEVDECIPLLLTAVAAEENMEVRSFFLGDNRTVPTNYKHVEVNPLRIDWANNANNYKEVITLAVDHADAEGRAFVTEYAGTSDVVNDVFIHPDADGSLFNDHATPSSVAINLLQAWGLMSCNEWEGCIFNSELIKPILDEYMPVPEGVNPWDFYDCPECFEGVANFDLWDGTAFGAKIEERILEPARHANVILGENPYLTRLYTTISPHEMTEDPLFDENPDLADIPALRMAQADIQCDDSVIWTLPGGMQVASASVNVFPEFPGEDPWAMTVEQGTTIGAPQVLADTCPQIISAIDTQNDKFNFEGNYGECGDNPKAGEDGRFTGDDSGSCACTSDRNTGGSTGLLLLGLAGLGLRRRRR